MSSRRRSVAFTPKFPRDGKGWESIIGSRKRLNIWEGSVRSGKTVASIVRWLAYVAAEAPQEGILLMTGRTSRTLERNVVNPILDMMGTRGARYNRGTGELHIFDRVIDCMGASDERAQEKIRGATVAGAYGDELTLWPESYFTMLLSRLSVRGAKFFGSTNPDSPYHWLNTGYLKRRGELNMSVFHFRLDDNPYLDPEYVFSLKKEYTGLWYKRFIDGLWVMAEGAIFDMWDEDIQTADIQEWLKREFQEGRRPVDRFRHYFVGIDYGTSNPCTFGLYGYDWQKKGQPKVHLLKEYYYDSAEKGRQKTDAQYADDFKAFLGDVRPMGIYCDPSAASFMSELRHRGYTVIPAENDVIDGIRFVGKLLSEGKFLIDKSCTHTIGEFSSYVWNTKAQQRGIDEPLKERDHAMDRNRYALFTHFFKHHPQALIGLNFR